MRGGRKKKPYYRIVVQDSRSRTRGREIDTLGVYHPTARPLPISEVNAVKALVWLRNGATPSDTVRAVFSKLGVMKHFHDGTNPEEAVALVKDEAVVDAGYNAPPPVEEAAPAVAEAAPEADVVEAPAVEAAEAPVADEAVEEKAE
jgi:small subunit ribosomal protein S16